jgi:hypothetical protein
LCLPVVQSRGIQSGLLGPPTLMACVGSPPPLCRYELERHAVPVVQYNIATPSCADTSTHEKRVAALQVDHDLISLLTKLTKCLASRLLLSTQRLSGASQAGLGTAKSWQMLSCFGAQRELMRLRDIIMSSLARILRSNALPSTFTSPLAAEASVAGLFDRLCRLWLEDRSN